MGRVLPRRAREQVEEALSDTRVVNVNGARQVGKSTLVHSLVRKRSDVIERLLDRATDLAAARADPNRFVRHEGLLVVDEIQRAPELILAIKAAVDDDPRPGQFLLTGSARLLGLRTLPDALVGRMETIELWPFSQGEIEQKREQFIDLVFSDEPELPAAGTDVREDYVLRLTRGGFHEAVRRDERRRAKFFDSYLNDLIERDVTQLAEIDRREGLQRLIRVLADHAARPLNVAALAFDVHLPATTVERYLTLFEEVFLIKRLPSWSASATKRAVQMRKLLFVDTGVCSHLRGRTAKRLLRDDTVIGPLLENFVLGELARQLPWAETRATLHHYRTRDGVEVDAVLEAADGRVVGLEVKSGETVRNDDFAHLRHLQTRIPDRFHLGVVFHTGKQTLSFGERLIAVPIDTLWTGV
ncbi:MAG: ATP-binding protein [Myxococcaceae bacterium]